MVYALQFLRLILLRLVLEVPYLEIVYDAVVDDVERKDSVYVRSVATRKTSGSVPLVYEKWPSVSSMLAGIKW